MRKTAEDIEWVRDAVPGAKLRPATAADALMRINDDGTVTIAPDVEVIEVEGNDRVLWYRTPRLRGWAADNKRCQVMADPSRSIEVAVVEELERQGRTVTRWTMEQANAARDAEIDRWSNDD